MFFKIFWGKITKKVPELQQFRHFFSFSDKIDRFSDKIERLLAGKPYSTVTDLARLRGWRARAHTRR